MVVSVSDYYCLDPVIYRYELLDNGEKVPTIMYPCGKCMACLSRKSNQWAVRLSFEMLNSALTYFVTLTYDDDHLRKVNGVQSLRKRDCQNFFSYFRDELPCRCRYYCVGEYGPTTLRPHYHALIFLDSMISKAKFRECLSKAWSKGFVNVKPCTLGRIYYAAKYVNKATGDLISSLIPSNDCEPPFSIMSINPPIGYSYVEKNFNKFLDKDFNFIESPQGFKSNLPRSFQRKLQAHFDEIKRTTPFGYGYERKSHLFKRGQLRMRRSMRDIYKPVRDGVSSVSAIHEKMSRVNHELMVKQLSKRKL